MVDGYYPQGEGPIWAWPREDAKRYKKMKSYEFIELIRIDRVFDDVGTRVQELIARLTSGGVVLKTDDPRIIQAKVLWDKGIGRELGFDSFEAYLATIPEIPARPSVDYLNKLVLVDRRICLVDACRMAGLKYNGTDETFKPFDPSVAKKHGDVYWMWCQDGQRNRKKKPSVCRKEFAKGEVGLDHFEFVALYMQDPSVIGTKENPHFVDLPGAVRADSSGHIACGGCWGGIPELNWDWRGYTNSKYGSASRWNG